MITFLFTDGDHSIINIDAPDTDLAGYPGEAGYHVVPDIWPDFCLKGIVS
jgi:hypothetical protein